MTTTEERLALLDRLTGRRILVIGDMIADVYLDGRISRISREAPVLVLQHAGERVVAGGAANVVNNVATLGGRALAAGIVGEDTAAEGLRAILEKNGAATDGLIGDAARPTTSKTRIIAGGRETVSQQIVRVDRESQEPLAPEKEAALWRYIEDALPTLDGLVLSDYGGAVVTEGLRRKVLTAARARGVVTIVDSRYAIRQYTGVDFVKQNDTELAAAVGEKLRSEDDLRRAGRALLRQLDAKGVLVTRGEKGMTLFEADGAVTDIPVADKSEVYDVSGAGDTCVAAVILALAANALPRQAAWLSNVASGIAVRKMGTATVSRQELAAAIRKLAAAGVA